MQYNLDVCFSQTSWCPCFHNLCKPSSVIRCIKQRYAQAMEIASDSTEHRSVQWSKETKKDTRRIPEGYRKGKKSDPSKVRIQFIQAYIYIYDSLHLTPYPELQARLLYSPRNPKTNTLTQIVHFPFSRVPEASGREPEAYRKLTGRITCSFLFYRSSGSSRKVSGRVTGSLLGAVVLHGSRKVSGRFPEGCPEGQNSLDIFSKPL